jgi:hypothetical protein
VQTTSSAVVSILVKFLVTILAQKSSSANSPSKSIYSISVDIQFFYSHSDSKTSVIPRQISHLLGLSSDIDVIGRPGRLKNSASSLPSKSHLRHSKARVLVMTPLHTLALTFQIFRLLSPPPPNLNKIFMLILCSKYLISIFTMSYPNTILFKGQQFCTR